MVGKVLAGRYEVLDRIGQGGMALVYRARDLALNRFVAIKMLKSQWAQDEDVVNRFSMEARAAASLDGRHIVQVYDVGMDEGSHYIVMELVNGPNLKDYIATHGPLDVGLALDVADQVAEALGEAHERQIIHRDIKPQNILVAEDGTAKVTDFGIARAMTSSTLVNTGSLLGTAQYLSPEQARGKAVGPATDLYGLGVVLFEMLTGSPPYQGDSPLAVALQHMQEPPPDLRSLRPDVPESVARLTARLLAKDADDRFSSAAAFRERLHEVQAGGGADRTDSGIAAAKAPVRRKNRERVAPTTTRRRRWTVVAAVVLVLLVLAGFAVQRVLAGPPLVASAHVVGRPVRQARLMLERQGFRVKMVGATPSNRVKAGRVAIEVPPGGSKLRTGDLVELTASSGPAKVQVPWVLYQDVQTAENSIKQARLVPVLSYAHNSAPANEVIGQTPSGTASVVPGSKVKLVVSSGPARPRNATVPNVTGDSTSQAASALSQVGLTLSSASYQYSTQAPQGVIIDQNPGPYGQVGTGGSVSVVLSGGLSPQSSGLILNKSDISWAVPSSAPPNSVVKAVVTDAAGNMEVYWAEVQPNETVPFGVVVWYGQQGQLALYLNGQLQGHSALVPTGSSSSGSSTSSSSSSSTSSSPSGSG
jgi:serine/threonine-protein kinase